MVLNLNFKFIPCANHYALFKFSIRQVKTLTDDSDKPRPPGKGE